MKSIISDKICPEKNMKVDSDFILNETFSGRRWCLQANTSYFSITVIAHIFGELMCCYWLFRSTVYPTKIDVERPKIRRLFLVLTWKWHQIHLCMLPMRSRFVQISFPNLVRSHSIILNHFLCLRSHSANHGNLCFVWKDLNWFKLVKMSQSL